MAATVEVRVLHGGAPGFGVDATGATLRFKRSDDDLQDANFPTPIPTAGVEYSWRKSLRLVTTASPDNAISNLRFFSDGGSLGTGRRILFNRDPNYTQATGADESAAIGALVATTLTDVAPETLVPGQLLDDAEPLPSFGTGQDVVELQLEVDPTATVGNSAAAVVFRYRYNES